MLKAFRRLEKTRSLVIIVFALLMGLSLIFFYAPSGRDGALSTSAMSREVLATVRGDKITVGDLDEIKAAARRMQQQIPFGVDRFLLDDMIRARLVAQEAKRLGLSPSNAEVDNWIRTKSMFVDPSKGFIGAEKYRERVIEQFGSVESFENKVREDLAQKKLEAFITAGVIVSEEEVQSKWERDNTKFELVYVPVLAKDLAKTQTPNEEEIAAYYESHKEDFRINDTQKKIRYLFISTVKMGERIKITDKELEDDYKALSPENKIAGVRVQQIVLKAPPGDPGQVMLTKASQLVASMRGDDLKATEERFAEIARGNSQDTATKDNGGWLPNPVRKDPNKKRDIYQNVYSLAQEGQVSDPYFHENAYYILRRGPEVPKTFEMAKEELLVSKRNRLAYNDAAALARRAAERLKETKNPETVARELAAEANAKPSEMIKETDFIKPGDDVPDIGSNPQFEAAIAPLNEPQDVGEQIGIRNGFAIPMLLDKRDPRIPGLDEVRTQVVERVKEQKAQEKLEQAARDLANATTPDELKAAAERLGLTAQTRTDFTVETALDVVGTSQELKDAIYALRAGEVARSPIKIGETWVVVAATGRTDAKPEEFAQQRDELMQETLQEQQQEVYAEYISSLRERLEREGKIKINEDVLAKLSLLDKPPVAVPGTGTGGLTIPVEP